MQSPLDAELLLARLRFLLARAPFAVGDRVEYVAGVCHRPRVDAAHLPAVPAGTRGVIKAIGPMRGCAGGATVAICDMAGKPTRWWAGARLRDLRRIDPEA
jgi:hypothetical protein